MNDEAKDLKYQWTMTIPKGTRRGTYMMLNTDMEVMYDIDVDNFKDGTKCTIGDSKNIRKCCMEESLDIECPNNVYSNKLCQKASTASLVEIYAKVNLNEKSKYLTSKDFTKKDEPDLI